MRRSHERAVNDPFSATEPGGAPVGPPEPQSAEDAELDRAAAVLARVHVLEARVAMETDTSGAPSEVQEQPEQEQLQEQGLSQDAELSSGTEAEKVDQKVEEEEWRRREEEAIAAEIRRMEEEGRKAHIAALEAACARSAAFMPSALPSVPSDSREQPSPPAGFEGAGLQSEPAGPADVVAVGAETSASAPFIAPAASPTEAPFRGASPSAPPEVAGSPSMHRAASPVSSIVDRAASPAGSSASYGRSASAAGSAASSRPGSVAGSTASEPKHAAGVFSRPTSSAESFAPGRSEAPSRPRSVLAYASRPSSAAGRSSAPSRPLSRATVMSSRAGRALMEDDAAADRVAALGQALPQDLIARANSLSAHDGTQIEPGSVRLS